MADELVKRLRSANDESFVETLCGEAADRIEQLTADFARQVQRTDEQREAYEQALSVMEAERDWLRIALTDAESYLKRGLDKSALSLISSVLKVEV